MNNEAVIEKPKKNHFFSIGPRVNRIQFLGLTILWLCLSFVAAYVLASIEWIVNVYSFLAAFFFIFTLAKMIMLKIRRLHDIGLSAWWMLVGLIPPIEIIFFLALFFYPGEKESNRFGYQPSRASKRYYLMICVPLVIFFLGKLSSILFLDESEMKALDQVSEEI